MTPVAAIYSDPVIAILVALLSGGLLSTAWQIRQSRQRGPTEMQDLVARVTGEVMTGAQDLLTEYRIKLEAAQRQIDAYLGQLADLNRLLGDSNARITRLERDLAASMSDRDALRRELDQARSRRDELMAQIADLRARVDQLTRQQHR